MPDGAAKSAKTALEILTSESTRRGGGCFSPRARLASLLFIGRACVPNPSSSSSNQNNGERRTFPAGTLPSPSSARLCHCSLPPPAKLGHFSGILLHMPSISIIRNKTVTGTQSQLAAPPPPTI